MQRTPKPKPKPPEPAARPPSPPPAWVKLLSVKSRAKLKRQLQREFLAQVPDLSLLDEPHKPSEYDDVRGPSGWVYRDKSIFCLTPWHEPRRSAILIVESKPFDPLILLTIMVNCMTMAWQSPLDPEGTDKAAVIDVCEVVFLAIFTCEMLIKILAYGFLMHRGSYLRDGWCQLDFVVVTLAWLPILFPNFGNYSVLRAFRALRPLRALKRLPGMPLLVQWILDVLPKMASVLALFGFIFFVFGIVGMELFKGSLHYRCALPGFREGMDALEQQQYDTGIPCNINRPDEASYQCGERNQLSAGTACAYFETNPEHGMVSFDSIGLVFVQLVQVTSFDDWAEGMYDMMNAFSPYAYIFHVLVIMLGGFFVVNLFLAVIFLELGSSKKAMDEEEAAANGSEAGSPLAGRGSPLAGRDSPLPGSQPLLDGVVKLSDGTERAEEATATGAVNDGLLATVANSSTLANASLTLVILNMVLMCMPYESMPLSYGAALEQCAAAITWAFIVEMGVKLLGLGWSGYWSDGWNRLDGAIVTLSIIDMAMTAYFASSGVKLSFLRILRILRVLRVLRLMRAWKGLYKIVATFLRAMPQMGNIIILILLTMFMFSLLGMQLFGGIYTEASGYSAAPCPAEVCESGLLEKPHLHFDYCYPAMITIFTVMTGEWVDAMHPVVFLEGAPASIFFIFVVMLGRFFLLNLLIAVILSEFAEDDDADVPHAAADAAPSSPGSPGMDEEDHGSPRASSFKSAADPKWPDDYSLLCFSPRNPIRRICQALIKHWTFNQAVYLAILVSSVALALDSPRLDPASELAATLGHLNNFFVGFFFLEMLMKVIATGFAFGEGAYLKSAWNQIDFVIVLISILVLAAEAFPQLKGLRVLRVLRVLRPLRLVSRNAGMKLIITSLFKALPAVSNVIGVTICLQVVFAIIGMQLFSGTMAACTDPTVLTRAECEATPDDHWVNPTVGSFDDFGSAMRLLYVMSSADEWDLPMFTMMGATEKGVAPSRNDFSPYALFPILWMFFSYVFAINLFVGAVVDNFSRMEKIENGSATMSPEQQQWVATMQTAVNVQPSKVARPPENGCRKALHNFVTSSSFDGFITTVVVLNIGVMACDYYGIEDDQSNLYLYKQAMLAFTFVYYVECILKLVGLGLDGYFGDGWNRFDFFLVCTSLVDQFAAELLAAILPIPPMLLRVLRILRILRILRLLRHAKGLRDLIVTMILSFPSLLNVGSLLALVIYIYAVLGLQLFTYVKPGLSTGAIQGGLTVDRNFHTFGSSFLLIFQCLTGDGWSSIMADASADEATGLCSMDEGNCGSPAAIPYFISFQVVGCFVFLNLIVAVILEKFGTLHAQDPDLAISSDVEMFHEAWTMFDPDATDAIELEQLPLLLLQVPRPLGLKGQTLTRAKQLCMRLRLFSLNGKVMFRDVLIELVENNYFRAGAGLELDETEFKGLVPGLTEAKARVARRASVNPQFSKAEFHTTKFFAVLSVTQGVIKEKFLEMLARARTRIAERKKASSQSRLTGPPKKNGPPPITRKPKSTNGACKPAPRPASSGASFPIEQPPGYIGVYSVRASPGAAPIRYSQQQSSPARQSSPSPAKSKAARRSSSPTQGEDTNPAARWASKQKNPHSVSPQRSPPVYSMMRARMNDAKLRMGVESSIEQHDIDIVRGSATQLPGGRYTSSTVPDYYSSQGLHFGVEFGAGSSASITIAPSASIDCNGTARCNWLAATPDLSAVVIDARAAAEDATNSDHVCGPPPPASASDAPQWGLALMRRQKGSAWPPVYTTAWVQCAADDSKQLKSVHLDASGSRVVATFAVVNGPQVLGAEVCAFSASDGAELWCTPLFATKALPVLVIADALAEDGQLVLHVSNVGLLTVDAGAKEAPAIAMLYNTSSNCCGATAITVSSGVAVMSLPDGVFNPPWCQCTHSRLIGIALPHSRAKY